MSEDNELELHKMAIDNAVAIFVGIVNGEYKDQEEDLLYDANLYIKGIRLYELGKKKDDG